MLIPIFFFLCLSSSLCSKNLRISSQNSNFDSNYFSVHIPVKGNSSNLHYYYIDLVIGSSLQTHSLFIDTSTFITTSPCRPFSNSTGVHKKNFYDVDKASVVKCKNASCKFKEENAEGDTIEGIYTKQEVRFNSR